MIRRIQEDDVLARSFLGELAEAQRHNDRIEEALSVFDNYVDPRDAYRDSDGTDWNVLGAGVGGKNRPATDFAGFANEQELTDARELCRRMFTNNEFVINGHNVRINYAVDTGFQFKAVAKDASKANPELVYQLQEFIDELLEENHWARRQRETVLRYDRDGEAFRRRFRQPDGLTMYRFIEPWQVTSLSIDETSRNLAFGVECEPDDDEKPVRYYVATISGENPQAIDAEDVQHLKANVDMNVRRGVPLFWPAGRNARRVTSVLRNVGIKDELAAALCVNRKHSSATTGTAASAFASGAATLRTTNPSTGAVTNHKAYGPGTILDTSKNTEYEALNIADGIDQMVMGLDAMLRALAAAAGLPEFMLTSNASNGNYSSTMVAEGPAVRTFRTIQSMLKAADLELIDDAIEWAIQCKRLPEGILDEVEIQVELPQLSTRDAAAEANANKTYLDAKVLSRQTLSSKLGLEYDQEQENIKAHDMAHPPEPSPMLGNPNDPNRAAAVGAMRGIMRTPESMDAFKALLESEYRSVIEHMGPGAHPNGTSQDVHGNGGKGVQYDLEPLNAKTDAAPEYAKSNKAAAILDSWTTPSRGSREGDYAKARSEMEAWVNGTKNQGMDDLYAETQAGLASRGIKTEKVFRGIALPVDHPLAKAIAEGRIGPNDSVLLEGATVASWSDSHPAAHSFAQSHKIEAGAGGKETYGVVLERVADVKDVLASHRVHRGFLAGEGEYIVRNTGKMKVRISSVTLPFGVKESESSQEHEFNVSECDNQRGIEKPKDA
jgi:hypothetical protein